MKRILVAVLASLMPLACSSDDKSETIVSSTQDISLAFSAKVGDQDFSCGSEFSDLGAASSTGQILDFKLYLHDIKVVTTDGTAHSIKLDENEWQSPSLVLLDFQDKSDNCSGENKQTHTAVTGQVSTAFAADIAGIEFKLGVPEELNHANQSLAASPLNITGMYWSWQAGYKFARIDFAPVGGITRPGDDNFNGTSFNFHLGSTACIGDAELGEGVSCEKANRPTIRLNNYKLDKTIHIDYSRLVSEINLSVDQGGAAGCMSGSTDPECTSMFNAIGLDLGTGENLSDQQQVVFSLNE